MTTIKRRLVDLERAVDSFAGPPTADQVRRAAVMLDAPDVGIL